VADCAFIVLSDPPEEISEAEFHTWYERHAREIVELPGFVAAERFKLQFVRANVKDPNVEYKHYVRYEIEGDFDEAWAGLRAAMDAGKLYVPDWFPLLVTAGWIATPLGRVEEA
jgi:hypothetical protein